MRSPIHLTRSSACSTAMVTSRFPIAVLLPPLAHPFSDLQTALRRRGNLRPRRVADGRQMDFLNPFSHLPPTIYLSRVSSDLTQGPRRIRAKRSRTLWALWWVLALRPTFIKFRSASSVAARSVGNGAGGFLQWLSAPTNSLVLSFRTLAIIGRIWRQSGRVGVCGYTDYRPCRSRRTTNGVSNQIHV
jgi:hypothetical protein